MMIFTLLNLASVYGLYYQARRRSAGAQADADLCLSTNAFVSTHFLDQVLDAAKEVGNPGEATNQEKMAAVGVADWAQERTERRRADLGDDWEAYEQISGAVSFDDSLEHFDLMRLAADETDLRRRSAALPTEYWHQGASYARVTEMLLDAQVTNGAGAFALANRGSLREQLAGCGSIVHTVNAAILAGDVEGIYVQEMGEADELEAPLDSDVDVPARYFFVTESKSLAEQFGALATAVTVGGSVVVYTLFEMCHSYGRNALALSV